MNIRRNMWMRSMVLVVGMSVGACAGPDDDPGPGDAPLATVQLYMNGEIFSGETEDDLLWVLAMYGPGEGETCMAYGPVEPDPAGGYNFENLVVLTARVSALTSGTTGHDLLVGGMYSYSEEYDFYDLFGDYEYDIVDRTVVVDPRYGLTTVMAEAPAELTNNTLVSQLQGCHYFEADASPAPFASTGQVKR